MLKIASEWGRKSKKLVMRDSIQFLNRKGKKFDCNNDELSDLIHPNIPADLPGINLKRDLHTPSRGTICRKPSVTEQAASARIAAGLDAPQEDNATTRGVDDAPATYGGNNTNEGVTGEGVGLDESGDDDLPRLTTEDDDSNST